MVVDRPPNGCNVSEPPGRLISESSVARELRAQPTSPQGPDEPVLAAFDQPVRG
jgi:hypothetical protein